MVSNLGNNLCPPFGHQEVHHWPDWSNASWRIHLPAEVGGASVDPQRRFHERTIPSFNSIPS